MGRARVKDSIKFNRGGAVSPDAAPGGSRIAILRADFGIGQRRPRGLSDPAVRRAIEALATLALEPKVPEEALAPYFNVTQAVGQSIGEAINLREDIKAEIRVAEPGFAENLLGNANDFARWRRRRLFRARHESGDISPILIAEGDSWFHFPIFLRDVVIQLSQDHLVWPLGAAGDTLHNLVWGPHPKSEPRYVQGLAEWGGKARAFLFSGGGNDLIGVEPDGVNALTKFVKPHEPGRSPVWHIDTPEYARRLVAFEAGYRHILADVGARYPNLPIVIHGYDYVLPYPFGRRDRRKPRWVGRDAYFGGVFKHLGIAEHAVQAAIMREVIDTMNAIQRRLAGGNVAGGAFPNTFHVDLRHTLGPHDWADEIHPSNVGYARIADRFRATLRSAGAI
jgi:hypothetical protein